MKKKFIFAIISAIIFSAAIVNAKELSAETDFETREIQLICALSSLAAYSGDESFLVRSNLDSRGWKIDAITNDKNGVQVKAYTISKTFFDGRIIKILVVAGTEDLKDVEVDFRLGGVPLHNDESSNIFVHKGFRDYADATLDGIAENLVDELKNNSKETLYLTGHSLGGSVALVMATRLNDMGVDKNQMKVITFGALAVGNQALANEYDNKIDFTRIEIKGDVVKKLFAPFGYVQFGEVITWKSAKNVDHHKHKMTMYLDCALRNYFDAEGFTFDDGIGENKIDVPIYVAPIKFVKKNFAAKDEKYIYGILRTGLTARFSNLTFDENNFVEVKDVDSISENVSTFMTAAKNSNCKYVLLQLVNADRVRDAKDSERQAMLYILLYDLKTEMPVLMQTSGASTNDLTLIEAVSFTQENLLLKLEKSLLSN